VARKSVQQYTVLNIVKKTKIEITGGNTMKFTNQFANCALALAVSLATTQVVWAEEEEKPAEGFVDASTLTLTSRNYYFNRDYRNVPGGGQSFREEWAQGEMLEYKSGYTQGTVGVGVGVDVYGYAGFKLDSGKGRANQTGSIIGLLSAQDSFAPEDSYGEAGVAVKARLSATELKYGDMRTAAPVFATGDAFLLPETATGFLLTSNEIENLTLEAGHFTAFNDYNSSNHDSELAASYGSGKAGGSISFGGATYTAVENLTLMLYAANYEEVWNQYFANINYAIPFNEKQSLTFDGNIYRTNDTGDHLQGEVGNTTYSIKASYVYDIHTISLAHQHVHGDTPFDYIGWDSIWLANSNQFSDFNAPNEKSVSLGYVIDLGEMVAPGLTAEAKYTKGDNIDGTKADPTGGYAGYYGANGHHWERDFDIKYVVQSGCAKDLAIRLRQATHRGNADQGDGAIDEVRLSFTYPWELI
jgi:imipenem/basic amino acid-specific outer membrane pore